MDHSEFPTIDRGVRALWAPVLLEPIAGSYERLVVGVVAVNSDGFHLELANVLSRLNCLYGESAAAAVTAVQIAGKCLQHDLAQRSRDAILQPESAVSGVVIGECREAEGFSLEQMASSWMAALSSLYDATLGQDALVLAPEPDLMVASEASSISDRLPFLVCDYVRSQREGYSRFFSRDLQEGRARRKKGASHQVVIDFAGPKLVANFGTLRAGSLTSSIHLIKRRLWDLKVERDRETQEAFKRSHEMILHRPSMDDPQVTDQQQANISEALQALEMQADQEDLRLLTLNSVPAIGERLLRYDEAA
ncbi:hypothetical protein [Phaeovulum sp. W22_SRMD_FR3]|uniref:hypothetical protein n=1 Tax=Phaeovulum sp. W22_SRMD_FR3 TaxID=3240274 RepID=UPI003F9B16A3